MRLPYRNKKVTLWVLFGIIVVTMFLFKFTELRPTCLFKVDANTNELSSQMVRVEVCTLTPPSCRPTILPAKSNWIEGPIDRSTHTTPKSWPHSPPETSSSLELNCRDFWPKKKNRKKSIYSNSIIHVFWGGSGSGSGTGRY